MSKITSVSTPLALLAAFTLFSAPTFAQQREHGRRNSSGQESSGRATERGGQPRTQAPAQAPAPQAQAAQPQAQVSKPQQQQQQRQQQRAVAPRVESRSNTGQYAVPRRGPVPPRYTNAPHSSNGYYYRPYYGAPYYAPRYYAPRYGYGVHNYYRPYVFRPHLSIGLGIFMGYPVPYAYSYPYPISVYGYRAPAAPIVVGPGSPYYGGVSLEITPYDADVYVDGSYAGRVTDFDGSTKPLTLTSGTHRIEVQSNGYAPLVFDVGVQAGQIIPYRGDLQPY